MQWKEYYYRMFLNYGVFLGNSLITVKYNLGYKTNLSYFMHSTILFIIILERNHEGGKFMLESEK